MCEGGEGGGGERGLLSETIWAIGYERIEKGAVSHATSFTAESLAGVYQNGSIY